MKRDSIFTLGACIAHGMLSRQSSRPGFAIHVDQTQKSVCAGAVSMAVLEGAVGLLHGNKILGSMLTRGFFESKMAAK